MSTKRKALTPLLLMFGGLLIFLYWTEAQAGMQTSDATRIEVRVKEASDDAEEAPSGNVTLNSSDLELVEMSSGAQTVGLRFQNVAIPAGATITWAAIQFQVVDATTGSVQLTLAGQAADDAEEFTAVGGSISARPRTAAEVTWSPPSWSTADAAGEGQRTPDIGDIIQEIVDRPGWSNGNSLAVIVTGSGKRTAEAYDGDTSGAPLMMIEYRTGGPTLGDGDLTFAVIGDYGDGSSAEELVATLVAGWGPDFVITTGDNNYSDGTAETIDDHIGQFYSQFIGNYQGNYGSGSSTNRFWPSLGNHDWHSLICDGSDCSGPYFDYFTLPGNERYYEVDFGLVHLFAIDSDGHEPDGDQPDSVQGNWLQSRLSASDSCFDVVYFHHPPYSSGNHGSDKDMRWPFEHWGADVVMSGHEHSYERLDESGFPYFVNGAGGKSLRGFPNIGTLPAGVTSEVRYNADYGAMLVMASDIAMTLQFINTDGALIDEYTINKDCRPDPTATPTPEPRLHLPLVAMANSNQVSEAGLGTLCTPSQELTTGPPQLVGWPHYCPGLSTRFRTNMP